MTWTEWRDTVVNHTTGRKASMSAALRDLGKIL